MKLIEPSELVNVWGNQLTRSSMLPLQLFLRSRPHAFDPLSVNRWIIWIHKMLVVNDEIMHINAPSNRAQIFVSAHSIAEDLSAWRWQHLFFSLKKRSVSYRQRRVVWRTLPSPFFDRFVVSIKYRIIRRIIRLLLRIFFYRNKWFTCTRSSRLSLKIKFNL